MTGDDTNAGPVVELTDGNFEREVEKSERPVVVIFFSHACPHCATIMPAFLEIAREFGGRVRFGRLDVVSNPWTIERFAIRSTPTFIFFCSGRPLRELVGAVLPSVIKKQVEEFERDGPECARLSSEIRYDISGYG
ncbi:MAG TPA: thioredoxin domain-containing protein [Methanoregulaceae archaeon]|nr:thioredoxin domain-containing protein [Methanoregulaceae archaeon]HQJ88534.1 thioredoxin domain-containing protein [Methanoregulaceae archaeon]